MLKQNTLLAKNFVKANPTGEKVSKKLVMESILFMITELRPTFGNKLELIGTTHLSKLFPTVWSYGIAVTNEAERYLSDAEVSTYGNNIGRELTPETLYSFLITAAQHKKKVTKEDLLSFFEGDSILLSNCVNRIATKFCSSYATVVTCYQEVESGEIMKKDIYNVLVF